MKKILVLATVMVMASLPGYGQKPAAPAPAGPAAKEQVPQQSYRLAFVVRETDERGKVLNSREYESMIAATPHHGEPNASIRTGARIPVQASSGQFTYMDVGVNFDILSFQVLSPTRIAMDVHAELSSVDTAGKQVQIVGQPVIHQNKWSGTEQMTLGQPKVIFTSDDLTSKNKVQVELTVTEVK